MSRPIQILRTIIQESLRVQRGSAAAPVQYIDGANALQDATAQQNHVIFGRRGCGKTLLLHATERNINSNVRIVHVNCEDYKQHSFPNVLIEILDELFGELESNLTGWFGRKKKSRDLIIEIRSKLKALKQTPDEQTSAVKELRSSAENISSSLGMETTGLKLGASASSAQKIALQQEYQRQESKLRQLNMLLPELKRNIREFFEISNEVKCVFLALDDFYHLPRKIQPHVADYVHRLCKEVPLFFKMATLRHVSALYADSGSQPIGIQERHDYQSINVDFTLENFARTSAQLRKILYAYGEKASMNKNEIDNLFMGQGFDRLVLAAGGVPRDFLSLLLEVLSSKPEGQEKIGKDDVRLLSQSVFQSRIQELKVDSEEQDQDALMRGIYALNTFCLDKKTNVVLVSDQALQQPNGLRELLNRLLDYRIIHLVGTALTHKSATGTFTAFMIDIGAYAKFRKLENRFNEIDVTASDARERCRNAPILSAEILTELVNKAPPNFLVEVEDMMVEAPRLTAQG